MKYSKNIRNYFALILTILSGAMHFAASGQSDARLKSAIDSLVKTSMDNEKAVGVSIGIVKNGKIFYAKGYGFKALGTQDPVDSLTNFHLASISKLFVATAIMQLAEQGKINIEAKLLDYIAVKDLKDERLKKVTIRQMLTHTSGFPDVENYHWSRPKNDSTALENYSKNCIQNRKLLFNPGEKAEYSNMAFEVLGHVIERVSGKPFDRYESDHVLNKAGMQFSNFDYHKIDAHRKSKPHKKNGETVKILETYPYNREHGPSSTLNSCGYDMCQFMLEILKIYKDENYNGLIKRETLLEMWEVKYRLDQSSFMGLGWLCAYTPLGICRMHSGGDPGYLSIMFLFPEQNTGVIVLMNGDYSEGKVVEKLPFEIALLIAE